MILADFWTQNDKNCALELKLFNVAVSG